MPALTPTMEAGKIVKWNFKEGDLIEATEPLCEVETDKALMDLDLPEDIILLKIVQGDASKNVPLGGLLGWYADKDDNINEIKIPEDAEEIEKLIAKYSSLKTSEPENEPSTNEDNKSSSPSTDSLTKSEERSHIKASPSVRALIKKYNIDPSTLKATGPRGTIQKSDVMEAVERMGVKKPVSTKDEIPISQIEKASTPSEFVDIPVSTIRGIVASRLSLSKRSIPHAYCGIDCLMDNALRLKDALKKRNIKVTVNDFIVKAASMALRVVPEMNATFENGKIHRKPNVDIAVAVSIPDGLITPIVRGADKMTITKISSTIQNLAERAKNRKLLPEEFQGSSFTISNLGMFGIKMFTAVINPPEVGILAVGTSRRLLSPNDEKSVINVMNASLSYDIRAVDCDTACRFIDYFRMFLEAPQFLDIPKECMQ